MSEQQNETSYELTAAQQAELKTLEENLAKFEGLKRWSDVIKTLIAQGELVKNPAQKVALFARAGELFIEKSSNQAEAIKCYQRVLDLDSKNVDAIARLKEMYEKRRDWEKLVDVMRVEIDLLEEDDRPLRYMEIADLATQRLRKPEICIDLWQKVLEYDPTNPKAIEALAGLYEKAREWEPLARVLEQQVQTMTSENDLVTLLLKLGSLYGEKLNDDRGAIRAFERLLELRPDERRAQEQLKKRYASTRNWDALERFYATTDKWDELIRVFEREADDTNVGAEERIQLLKRVARLWAEKKDKQDRAARSYEKILELDAQNLDAAVALSPIYEQGKDAKKLAAVYEVRLKHVDDVEERLALLRETGLVYEERLKDAETAFAKYLEALSLVPGREVAREDVARLAGLVDGGWDKLVVAYERAIDGATDPIEITDLRLSAGQVLTQIGRVDDAITQLSQVYDAEPDNMRAAQALEPLYRQTGRYGDVLEIYRKRQDLESDPGVRRELAYHIAQLQENELKKPEEAIDSYQAIISEYGDDESDAYRALERLLENSGKHQELADILQRRIDLGPPEEELAALKFRLGRVQELHLGATEEAIALYREILSMLPEHEGARAQLEALLSNEAHGRAAAEILEPMYEATGEWDKLVRALEVLVEGADTPEDRLALLTKIGQISAGPLNNAKQSFDAFMRGFREVPSHFETLQQLEALALEQDRFHDLVKLIVELAEGESDPDLARTLYMKAAEHYATQLGEMEGAVRCYNQILESDPGDEEALSALETLYRVRERWPELVSVLRRRVELAVDPTAKEELLAQMAEVHKTRLNQPAEAIARYREVLELDPGSPRALSALDGLYEAQGMWSDLADNVARELDLAEKPQQQIELMLRLGALREQRMGAVEAAVDIYREVLSREPMNATALSSLERLMALPEHELAVAEILEPLYADMGEYQKLVRTHEIQVRHAGSVEQRVQLLTAISDLYEVRLGDLSSAVSTFARALGEDPSNEDVQSQLERVALAANETERLARIYEERVEAVNDPLVAAQLYVKAAQIRENMLGDVESAIAHYRRVLELDSSHLEAASALERLYMSAQRYEELASIYLAKAKMLGDLDEQKQHFYRAAQIYEEVLSQPLMAIDVYKQVLEIDAEDLPAIDSLIDLYLKLSRWEDLLATYTKKADIVSDPEEKKAIHAEVGAVYERELKNNARAIESYQRMLEVDPDDRIAIGRLDALYVVTGNWTDLLGVLERQVELAVEPQDAVSYRFRIAELWDKRLNDSAQAVEGFREILELSPDHEPTLSALEDMIAGKREPLAAAEVLDPVFRQLGEWQKLAQVQEVRIEHESDPLRKVELLHGLAELFEVQLNDARAAFDAFGRSLAIDPQNEATQRSLERLAESLGAFGEVTKLYDQGIEALRQSGDGSHIELALRAAQILEIQVENIDEAIGRYRIVVDADPSHAHALEALDRLYESTNRWSDLVDVMRKEMEIAPTPDDMLDLQFRLGQVLEQRLGRVADAVAQYREIINAAPEYQPAVRALETLFAAGHNPMEIGEVLEPLYRMQGAWTALVGVHEVQLAHQSDALERVSMMHRVAEIAEDKAGDSRLAFLWMQRALLEEPLNEHTDSEVERLARITDGWSVLANTYADVVSNGVADDVKVSLGRKLARVYENELADVSRAEESYRFVLGINKADAETLEALDRIYVEHHAFESLAEVLRLRVKSADSEYDKTELSYRLGQVLEIELGLVEEAIAVYEEILTELNPEHAESVHALERAFSAKGDWAKLYQTYDRALKVVVGDSNQADIYARMARLAATHLGQVDKSIALWKQVLDLRGEDPEALRALGEVYATQSNWRDLVDILEREAAVAESDEDRIRIFSELGRVWYEKLERARSALESWERVLDIDPARTPALFAIADIHRANKSNEELVQTLHRIIDVGAATLEDYVIESVYMELGGLYERELQQPADAVDAYNHAVDVNPRNFAALDAMERIHSEQGDWEARITVKERRVNGLDEASDKIAVLLDIAKSWAEDGEQRSKGISALNRVIELDPLHEEAFNKLEELLRASESWEQLVDLYLARVEATSGEERIALLHKVANVYEEKLNESQQAFDALLVAWSEDFLHKQTARELERLAGPLQGWGQLLTTANEALQQELEQDVRIGICLRCARWYGKYLERPDYAIPYYQQILQLDPTHVAAMGQMADLYRQTGQWDTVYQVLSRMLEVATNDDERMDVYVQLGELCEKQLGRPEQATAYYRQALELDGAHIGALVALERIYRERGEWNELVEVLKRKASFKGEELASLDPEDLEVVLAAKQELAAAYRDHFNDVDKAIECLEEVIAVDAQNLVALRAIEPLYQQTERFQNLPKILEAQLEAVSTEKERIVTLMKLAHLFEVEFVKPEKAAERLEQVLDVDPNHLEALTALSRIYRMLQRWQDVISTYERHVAATAQRADKIAIFKALGDVYANELKDYGRAIDVYLNVTNLDEVDVEALDALSRLYERTDDYPSAIDALERLARVARDSTQQVDLHYRIARILEDKLGDRSSAVEHYERAIDIDPSHLPSLESMRKVYVDNGDWLAAARTLEREVQSHQNPRVLTRLHVELGSIYRERLDERAESITNFEAALRYDDANDDAALPLVDDYLAAERYEEALPLLQLLSKTSSKRSPDENQRLSFLLGQTAAHVDDHALAVKAYGQAYTIDPSHLPTIQGLAASQFALKDWEKAGKFYQLLLMQHRDDLTPDEVTTAFHQLGVIKLEQGERRKALNMFDKALEQDPAHRDTLARVIDIHSEDGSWDQVIHYKKQLLEGAPLAERLTLLQEIADLWRDRLDNRQKAIEAMVEATSLEPKNHVLLHKLLGLFQETKQWKEATDIIQRIADLDERAVAKAKYAYTVGVILRDELKDIEGALARFNEALDLDPTQLKPFEAINKLLTQVRDWKNLERAFRKMLHRLMAQPSPDPDLQFNLWHNLGIIYRDRLKQPEAGAQAFKMASDIKPGEDAEHQILGELFAKMPNKMTEAVAEYEHLLRRDAMNGEWHQALYKLYFDAREYDKAWCVARTLVYLKSADRDQTQFYDQYKVASGNPSARLTAERWIMDLYHPDQDKEASMVFRALCQPLFKSRYSQLTDKQVNLHKSKPVDLTKETASFAQAFALGLQVLSPDVRPRLFLRGDLPQGITHVPAENPATICGSLLLRGHKPKELQFAAAHHLAYHRAEHYVRRMYPARTEVQGLLLMALRSIGERPGDAGLDKSWESLRAVMQPAQQEELAKACKLFVKAGARTDVKRWIQCVELTACRAGFLVANDLEASLAMLPQVESAGPDDLPPAEKTKELILFSVSQEYFRLREAIGITLRLA